MASVPRKMEEILKAYQQFINGERGAAGARRGQTEWTMKMTGGKEKVMEVKRAPWWGHQSRSTKKGGLSGDANMKSRLTDALKNWEKSKNSRQVIMDSLGLSEEEMKREHFQIWNAPRMYRKEVSDAVQTLITEACKITGLRLSATADPSEDVPVEWMYQKDDKGNMMMDASGSDMTYRKKTISLKEQRERLYDLIEAFKISLGKKKGWKYDREGNEIGDDEDRDGYLMDATGEKFERVNEVYLASRATKMAKLRQTPYEVPEEILDHQKKMADLFEEVWTYMGGEKGYLDGDSTDPMKAKTPYHYLKDNEKKS